MTPSSVSAIVEKSLPRPVLIAGGGPAGLLSALALVQAGIQTVLVTPEPPPPGRGPEARTAALFMSSLALLEHVGIWHECLAWSAPLLAIRMIDDRGGLLRAPEVVFHATEAGQPFFGYNVPNSVLAAALRGVLRTVPSGLTWIEGQSVTVVTPSEGCVRVGLSDGQEIEAVLAVGADGRMSVCRAGAQISVREHSYDQVAVTANFSHQRSHQGISTELHGPAGPCTTVPLPGRTSSLVWIERPAIARRLAAMDDISFASALETRLQGVLGAISHPTPRAMFPLSWMQASRYAARRVALIGEAAHVMPPIGAQGLNLGLRDVGWLLECVEDAQAKGGDIGGDDVLDRYNAARSADIGLRMGAVDALNRSLLSDLLPVHLARGFGLHLVASFKPLRQRLMANGLQPSGALPRTMQRMTLQPDRVDSSLDGSVRALA